MPVFVSSTNSMLFVFQVVIIIENSMYTILDFEPFGQRRTEAPAVVLFTSSALKLKIVFGGILKFENPSAEEYSPGREYLHVIEKLYPPLSSP